MSWAKRPQSVCLFEVDGAVNYGFKWVVVDQVDYYNVQKYHTNYHRNTWFIGDID